MSALSVQGRIHPASEPAGYFPIPLASIDFYRFENYCRSKRRSCYVESLYLHAVTNHKKLRIYIRPLTPTPREYNES